MADKKIERKIRTISNRPVSTNASSTPRAEVNTTSSSIWDFFRFGESYTSLILGIVVVIIAAVLLVSFVKNKNLEQLTKHNPAISSVTTSKQAENAFPRSYTVQPGDDLWKIAEKTYNDGYQWVAIAKANNITNPSQITTGQKLQLPKIENKNIAMSVTSTPTPIVTKPTVTPVKAKSTITPLPTRRLARGSTTTNVQITNPSLKGAQIPAPQSSMSPISGNSYTVVHGDNLWNIAVRAYGDGFQWKKIADANHLANPRIIHAGNVFVIPR